MSKELVEEACSIACHTGHNIRPMILEITLRSQLPADYQDNARLLTNAKRRMARQLNKAGFRETSQLLAHLVMATPYVG